MSCDNTTPLELVATPYAFEGVEKKLEIDFKLVRANVTRWAPFPPPKSTRADGLRAVPREFCTRFCVAARFCILLDSTRFYVMSLYGFSCC